MADKQPRTRILQRVSNWPHRYAVIRTLTLSITLAVLFLVPSTGVARMDVWGGQHLVLGKPADAISAFIAVSIGIVAFYAVTFLLNLFLGRLFCGWGCPVAQVSRFGERIENASRSPKSQVRAHLLSAGFGTLLATSVMLWWISPRVLLDGSWSAIAATLGVYVLLLSSMYLHGRFWRWGFCKKLCPIGLYYSVVTSEKSFGIVFHRGWNTCKECDVCTKICPVDLEPRRLAQKRYDIGGAAVDGLPASNHCLTCGDCVRACEWVFRKDPDPSDCPLAFGVEASENRSVFGSARPFAQSTTAPEPQSEDRQNE